MVQATALAPSALMAEILAKAAILGVQAPWHINRVDLDTTGERVDLWAEHTVGARWRCPDCETELPGHDHVEERIWRHLDTCQFQTFLHTRIPRVDCPTHGVDRCGCRGPKRAVGSRC